MKKIITTIALAFSLGANAQIVSTLAGSISFGSSDGTGAAARFNSPSAITVDGNGNLFVGDNGNNEVRKIVISSGVVSTLAGPAANLNSPWGVVTDGTGNLYVVDQSNQLIKQVVISSGVVTTLAGSGGVGSADGASTSASFLFPLGIATDGNGNLYVADANNNEIRKIVISSGVVSTIAGSTTAGFADGIGTAAQFSNPTGLAYDGNGNLFVADEYNSEIRKIVLSTGQVSTFAGSTTPGFADGIGTAAGFNGATGITADGIGNLYVADKYNHAIRKIVISSAVVTTIAGSTTPGAADGVGISASFNYPTDLTIDAAGNLYIADAGNNLIRVIKSTPGAALNFDASSNQVNVGNALSTALGTANAITVEAWVNLNDSSYAYHSCIVGNYASPTSGMQFLLSRAHGNWVFGVNTSSGYQNVGTPAGYMAINKWVHLAGVWDGSKLMIYVNGALIATKTGVTGANLTSTTNSVVIGYESAGTGEPLNGSVDEVRIWNRALCKGEIQNSMNTELQLPQTGLLAYYTFNEGVAGGNNSTVTTIADSSGNGNNGTLTNFALSGTTSNWVAPSAVTTGSYAPSFVPPVVTVNSATICAGNTATLTANSSTAVSYTWSTGDNTTSIAPSPTTTVNYTVTATDANNCVAFAVDTVTVNQLPAVAINGTPTYTAVLCVGSSGTLTASGATTYTWMPLNSNLTVITGTIASSASVTLTGTDANGCVNTATAMVTANPVPVISSQSGSVWVCDSTNATFSVAASGNNAYQWYWSSVSNSDTTNNADIGSYGEVNYTTNSMIINQITSDPNTGWGPTGAYQVQCLVTGSNGCAVLSSPDTIFIFPNPNITITASTNTICAGLTATLTASGTATTYSWSNTGDLTASINPVVNSTTQFTVTGVDNNGCMRMDTLTIGVQNCTTGIEQSASASEVAVYPNPNNGNFIVITTANPQSILVTDVLGNELMSITPNSLSTNVSLSAQPNGVYFIKVMANGKQTVKRITITN